MLISEQKTALKRYGFDDNDPLLTWLKAAMYEVIRAYNWPWLYSSAQIVVAAGASALALPADAFRIQSIKDLTHPGIKLRSRERTRFDREIADTTVTGKAQFYCLTGLTTVQLWPVLDSQTTFQVTYHRKVVEPVNDTDTMDIPLDLHYTVVHGAAAIALQAESEEERSSVAQNQFESAILAAIGQYAPKDEDEPKQVVDVMGYGYEYR